MEVLPWVLTGGWASGINAYLVVLMVGLLGRFGGLDGVPSALERTDVLVAAAVMFALEFVTDKIPYVDSAWDTVHTAIRPTIGAVLGALVAGDAGTLEQALAAAGGGLTALLSHGVKAGLRLAVNTSPEPASNVTVSLGEDLAVAGVVSLAVVLPWVALGVAMTLLATGLVLVGLLAARVRRGLAARRARRARAT